MPSYKDDTKKSNKWYCSFYYTDATGKRVKKKKQGFPRKADADEWEREFLLTKTFSPSMRFDSLSALYLEDQAHRVRANSLKTMRSMLEQHILPFFASRPVDEIAPVIVRSWQNEIIQANYKPTYQRALHAQLSAVFNYAVKYHGLTENPCKKAGTIGKSKAGEMNIWTVEEFERFAAAIADKPPSYCGFHILFWCGLRIGELLALTWQDVDLEKRTITINKSFQRLKKITYITPPKTEKSNRIIAIDAALVKVIEEYRQKLYSPSPTERVIPLSNAYFDFEMKRGCTLSGVPKIRIHDLRHSHVSFLINHGISPLAIAKRVGHDKVETTLSIYSHLYPVKELEIIEAIEKKYR